MVFAHYMLITRPPNGDYTQDMQLAKAAGIDAFAVNYGGWGADFGQQDGYLSDFFNAAESAGMKAFVSIDTTSVTDPVKAASVANAHATSPAQLTINGKVVLSTFSTDLPTWDWKGSVLPSINGGNVFFIPGTISDDAGSAFSSSAAIGADGCFTWIHPTLQSEPDGSFALARGSQKWMAGVAPWFFKRFDAADNWSHAQDDAIFIDRFLDLLDIGPDFIEMVTWNDWGESSYIGPADTTGSVPTAYWAGMDHSAFRNMVACFIKAFKSGQTKDTVTVDPADEGVYLFYRLQPAQAMPAGGSGNSSLPLPLDSQYLKDQFYIVSFLSSPAEITFTANGANQVIQAPAGVFKTGVPLTFGGAPTLSAVRNGQAIASKTGPAPTQAPSQYNGNVVVV